MEQVFVIVMLCNDFGRFYVDYVNKYFTNYDEALACMNKCVSDEVKSLRENGNFEVINFGEQVAIYDENKELVTEYQLLKVGKEV